MAREAEGENREFTAQLLGPGRADAGLKLLAGARLGSQLCGWLPGREGGRSSDGSEPAAGRKLRGAGAVGSSSPIKQRRYQKSKGDDQHRGAQQEKDIFSMQIFVDEIPGRSQTGLSSLAMFQLDCGSKFVSKYLVNAASKHAARPV